MTVISSFVDVASAPFFWLSVSLFAVISYAVQLYVSYRRLAHFKGPFWAAFTELWLVKVTWKSQIHTTMRAVHDEYGRSQFIT
jgi:hypothetical protein